MKRGRRARRDDSCTEIGLSDVSTARLLAALRVDGRVGDQQASLFTNLETRSATRGVGNVKSRTPNLGWVAWIALQLLESARAGTRAGSLFVPSPSPFSDGSEVQFCSYVKGGAPRSLQESRADSSHPFSCWSS